MEEKADASNVYDHGTRSRLIRNPGGLLISLGSDRDTHTNEFNEFYSVQPSRLFISYCWLSECHSLVLRGALFYCLLHPHVGELY